MDRQRVFRLRPGKPAEMRVDRAEVGPDSRGKALQQFAPEVLPGQVLDRKRLRGGPGHGAGRAVDRAETQIHPIPPPVHRPVNKTGDAVFARHRGEIRVAGTCEVPRERPHDIEGMEPRHAVAELFGQQVGEQHPLAVQAASVEIDEREDLPREPGLGGDPLAELERVSPDRQGDPDRPASGGVIVEDLPQP